jgi:hypothetical protein
MGKCGGHSPRNRIQHCLEQLDRGWVTVENRPIFNVTFVKSKERLEGLDFVVDSHPPQSPMHELFGRLRGPTVRARLLWALDDLAVNRVNLPELPL